MENLEPDNAILPPVFRKQRGRPKTKHIRKGAWRRKAIQCSTCLSTGHNSRTCRLALVVNGRRQRAQDRESSISSSECSTDSDIDSNNDDKVFHGVFYRRDVHPV
jgi:hypothetical protein